MGECMGDIRDKIGSAMAYAESGARHDNEKLEKRIADLEHNQAELIKAINELVLRVQKLEGGENAG